MQVNLNKKEIEVLNKALNIYIQSIIKNARCIEKQVNELYNIEKIINKVKGKDENINH
jgi:hypothetical protein